MRYRWWLLIAGGLFGTGFVSGLTIGLELPAAGASYLNETLDALWEMGGMVEPFRFSTVIFIFVKNVTAVLTGYVFSPLLCLLPVIALLLNGWLLAFVGSMVAEEISLGFALGGLLPHGIIELPALVIGEAAALYLGSTIIASFFSAGQRQQPG